MSDNKSVLRRRLMGATRGFTTTRFYLCVGLKESTVISTTFTTQSQTTATVPSVSTVSAVATVPAIATTGTFIIILSHALQFFTTTW